MNERRSLSFLYLALGAASLVAKVESRDTSPFSTFRLNVRQPFSHDSSSVTLVRWLDE